MDPALHFTPPDFAYRINQYTTSQDGVIGGVDVKIAQLVDPDSSYIHPRLPIDTAGETKTPTTSPVNTLTNLIRSAKLSSPKPIRQLFVAAKPGMRITLLPAQRGGQLQVFTDISAQTGTHYDGSMLMKHLQDIMKLNSITQSAYMGCLRNAIVERHNGENSPERDWTIDHLMLFSNGIEIVIGAAKGSGAVPTTVATTNSGRTPIDQILNTGGLDPIQWDDVLCQRLITEYPHASILINPFRLQNLAASLATDALVSANKRHQKGIIPGAGTRPLPSTDNHDHDANLICVRIRDLSDEEADAVLNLIDVNMYINCLYLYLIRMLGSARDQERVRGFWEIESDDGSNPVLFAIDLLNNLRDEPDEK